MCSVISGASNYCGFPLSKIATILMLARHDTRRDHNISKSDTVSFSIQIENMYVGTTLRGAYH